MWVSCPVGRCRDGVLGGVCGKRLSGGWPPRTVPPHVYRSTNEEMPPPRLGLGPADEDDHVVAARDIHDGQGDLATIGRVAKSDRPCVEQPVQRRPQPRQNNPVHQGLTGAAVLNRLRAGRAVSDHELHCSG